MARIVEPLEKMGARVVSEKGKPPLRIEGRHPLTAIRYELPVASAQVKSCLLLAGLNAQGRTEVVEPLGFTTREDTERMLKWFGVPVEISHDTAASCAVVGPASFSGREVRIPGDFSSAAFLIAAATMLPGSELEIENLGLNPTRTPFSTCCVQRARGSKLRESGKTATSQSVQFLFAEHGNRKARWKSEGPWWLL